MHRAIEDPAVQSEAIAAFQLHKSLGLTVLVLSLLRLLWRLLHRPPPLPAHMPAWERLAAKATHWAFYGLMLALPLSGWVYVSTQWRGDAPLTIPTLWFGWLDVPHLFGLEEASAERRAVVAAVSFRVHFLLAWGTAGLLALHVAAALKHHLHDRDAVLRQMLPVVRRPLAWLVGGAALVLGVTALAIVTAPLEGVSGGAAFETGGQAITSTPDGWRIDPAESAIEFAGTHAGRPFRGRFTRWQANLRLRPEDPPASRITATIHTGSATDGVKLHDETLPKREWFHVAAHPTADFRATTIRPREGGGYAIDGILTIKERPIEVTGLRLTLNGDIARIEGELTLDRKDADMGMESDPAGRWVSREIDVSVEVLARAE